MHAKIGAAAVDETKPLMPQGVKNTFSGAGKVLGGALTYGFPVYQYVSGEESIGGALGSMAGGSAGSFAGNTIGKALGHPLSVMGRTLRRTGRGAVAGTLLDLAGKGIGLAGGIAGGILGFGAGSNIGNRVIPIHKRNSEAAMPSPMLPSPMIPHVKQASSAAGLSQKASKILFHGGGLAGAALAAYYGNKNFNQYREALQRRRLLMQKYQQQYPPMYPQQFYNEQQ